MRPRILRTDFPAWSKARDAQRRAMSALRQRVTLRRASVHAACLPFATSCIAQHGDGLIAMVVVDRALDSGGEAREAYRDETMAGGHRWPSPEAARLYAVAKVREVIRMEQHRLAC